MTFRFSRHWIVTALAVGAGCVLLFAIAHTPPARARVLAWLLAQLESRYAIEAAAERLDFNLATLDVELYGVELAA